MKKTNDVEQNEKVDIRTLQLGKNWFPENAGGLERMYYNLLHSLPTAGVSAHGLVAGEHPAVTANANQSVEAFAPATAALPTRLIRMRRATRCVLQQRRPALVAAHFALYALPALDLLSRYPLVVHFHGPWANESLSEGEGSLSVWVKTQIEKLVYHRGVRFIVLSEAFQRVLCSRYGVPAERVRVVPGGVNVNRFDTDASPAEARARLGWPSGRPIALSVRRLARRMGLENLVEAMRRVHRDVPDALLLIAGKGPLASKLRTHVAEAELDEHVRLLGFVPDEDLPLAYRAADVSIVPTVALEGFGLITIESLAAGTPVLVTPVGGLPETVRGLSETLVLEGSAPSDLSPRLTEALRGKAELPAAETCRRYVREHFDWPVIAEQVREVYEEALAHPV